MKSTSKKIAFVLLVSVIVAGGIVAQEPTDRTQRLAAMKAKGPGRFAHHTSRAACRKAMGSLDRSRGRPARTAGPEEH